VHSADEKSARYHRVELARRSGAAPLERTAPVPRYPRQIFERIGSNCPSSRNGKLTSACDRPAYLRSGQRDPRIAAQRQHFDRRVDDLLSPLVRERLLREAAAGTVR